MGKGKVYLVGAGPGDSGLFTLKGVNCLKKAEVIIYDNLVNPDILSYAQKETELIFAGKSPKGHTLSQEQINRLLVKKAAEGKTVVRLKGGDPFLFGRAAEEALALASARVPFEIVPGVTSALAVPSYAGIPITYRKISSGVTIITGHEDPLKKISSLEWDKLLQNNTTLVILMGMGNLKEITSRLIAQGAKDSLAVAVITNGTLPSQRVLLGTLGNIADKVKKKGFQPPAVIVIGRVVNLRQKLNWFGKNNTLPLLGKRILVTRPSAQADAFVKLLKAQGAEAIKMPLIEITPPEDSEKIERNLSQIDKYNWVVFTSANGVDYFMQRLKSNNIGIARLKTLKFAVIGCQTLKRLESFGLKAKLMPEQFRQEALGKEIIKKIEKGARILLAQAEGSRDVLHKMLKKQGFKVNRLAIYRTKPIMSQKARLRELFLKRKIDIVTLTSSSCVEAFVRLTKNGLRNYLKKVVIAVIGPVCKERAEKLGLPVDVIPKEYTISGLTEALIER